MNIHDALPPDGRHTALLSIDLQMYDIDPGSGLLAESTPEDTAGYLRHMQETVIPNVAQLQAAFRAARFEVLHARLQSMTQDGRDRSPWHKSLGIHVPPGSPQAEFISEVKPLPDEMVFNKTASGVFGSTNLHYVLANLEIRHVFVCGVFTDECVASAVRAGCDAGYTMWLVSDACMRSAHLDTPMPCKVCLAAMRMS